MSGFVSSSELDVKSLFNMTEANITPSRPHLEDCLNACITKITRLPKLRANAG